MRGLFTRGKKRNDTRTWDPPIAGVAAAHMILRDQMARRRGGAIGIGNRGAIALRFDHGAINFRDIVVPLLRRYGLPASQAYPTEMFTGRASAPQESVGLSWDDARQWAATSGVEPLAHSRTHKPADTEQALYEEIVVARDELAAALPESAIETWAVPGGGGTEYMGFNDGNAPDRFYDTIAGAMILSTYGFSTGSIPGIEWPLDGRVPVGAPHSTVDKASALAAARTRVRAAIEHRTGYVVMLHPRFLTYGKDYTTPEQLEEFLAYVAHERTRGRLEVMTVGGLAHAQTGSTRRLDLVDGGAFPDDWASRFDGASEWSRVADRSATTPRHVVRTPGPAMLSQTLPSWRVVAHRGIVLEVSATVRSTGGATAQIGCPTVAGAVSDHDVPDGNRWRVIRQHVTLPLNGTGPATFTVGSAGGPLDVLSFRVRPV